MLTDDFFLSCQVLSLSAALLVSGEKKKITPGWGEQGWLAGKQPGGTVGCHSCSAGQPRRQRAALGPVQPPDSPAARADSSLVSEGFFSPPPLRKIPQLVLLIVSLAYCTPGPPPPNPLPPKTQTKKPNPKQKLQGKKRKNPCGFAIWRWASNPLGQPEDGGMLAQLPPAYTWALTGCPRAPLAGRGRSGCQKCWPLPGSVKGGVCACVGGSIRPRRALTKAVTCSYGVTD